MTLKDQHYGETGHTTPTQGQHRQTKPTEVKVFTAIHQRTNKSKQTIPNLHSPLTYGLSDMENYNFEFMELNRSLNVHYQGGKIQKGRGQGGGCMPQIFLCMPKKINEIAVKITTFKTVLNRKKKSILIMLIDTDW